MELWFRNKYMEYGSNSLHFFFWGYKELLMELEGKWGRGWASGDQTPNPILTNLIKWCSPHFGQVITFLCPKILMLLICYLSTPSYGRARIYRHSCVPSVFCNMYVPNSKAWTLFFFCSLFFWADQGTHIPCGQGFHLTSFGVFF